MICEIKAACTGNYKPLGNLAEADCVIGQSFGVGNDGPGYVNELLGQYIVNHASHIPWLLQSEIAVAIRNTEKSPAYIAEGKPSTAAGNELDSWEVLKKCKAFMDSEGLRRPLLVAQAFHVGRVCLQAKKVGIQEVIVPSGLPKTFDPYSEQSWTRNRAAWAAREIPGMMYLKIVAHKL